MIDQPDAAASPFAAAPRPATGAGWGWIMAYGVVSVALGAAAFVWPFAATAIATVAIGAFLFVSGVLAIAAGLLGHGSESRGYSVLLGIVGAIMALEPATGALSLTLMVAIWLAVRGMLELYWGFRLRRRKALMIALGAANLLLAIFILWTVPYAALTLPGFILGISFVFGGVAAITAASDHRNGADAFATPEPVAP
jgi:uncharacterized membrane protein HdeD (DUF308 family)